MEISEPYLDFADYQKLGGTLSKMPFTLLEYEARKQIDLYTFGRLQELDEQVAEVQLCDFALINVLEKYSTLEKSNKAITNETTDGYSVTYATFKIDDLNVKKSEIKDIIYTYLANCKLEDGTPYLYRGIK